MLIKEKTGPAQRVLEILPRRLSAEVFQICRGRREGICGIREIRIRAGGRASLRFGNLLFPLFSSIMPEELSDIVGRICGGAVYAHRDRICSGYLPFGDGVRVGVVGTARYEGGRFVGVDNISSLVFRIPGGYCDIDEQLVAAFSKALSGMIIYSPPGGGKTTALRSLAYSLGSGKSPRRVCVVDEREEFFPEDYTGCEVDILKGYKRREGLDIATRTMSPDVVMIDEIGSDDASEIADAVRAGIPIIATAHAGSFSELMSKTSLKPLYSIGAFDVFAGITECKGRHILTVDKYE